MSAMSPTAQALANASAARDVAMRLAHEAEGKPEEPAMDALFAASDVAYRKAARAHRAARAAAGDAI